MEKMAIESGKENIKLMNLLVESLNIKFHKEEMDDPSTKVDLPNGKYYALQSGYCLTIGDKKYKTKNGVRGKNCPWIAKVVDGDVYLRYLTDNERAQRTTNLLKESDFLSVMTRDQMEDFLSDNDMKNAYGELDTDDIKQISGASDEWVLKKIPVKDVTYHSFPSKENKRRTLPIVVLQYEDGTYEILDGKHRAAEANFYKDNFIDAYVGKPWEQ